MPHGVSPTLIHTMVPCLLPPLLPVLSPRRAEVLAGKPPESWTVEEVEAFMYSIPDFAMHARKFRIHLIDGEAMFLLEIRHLVRIMKIKLGPALKIYSVIDLLRSPSQCPCSHLIDT